jgi:predicted TIM-barrel fold metal-dependent hydrolase
MKRSGIDRSVVFGIDEPDAGATYEPTNRRVVKAIQGDSHFIGFMRLNPRAGERARQELARCQRAGLRGVKLHPRSESFSARESEDLIAEIEKENLPVILHASHEKNCRPLSWEGIFKRHSKIPFILAHGGKDAFQEAIAVARRNRNVWVETSTLSYWRTGMILRELGPSRMVFGSDSPYSHPALERLKLDLLLSPTAQRKVYSENPRRILGE